jgi:hypothetical protein
MVGQDGRRTGESGSEDDLVAPGMDAKGQTNVRKSRHKVWDRWVLLRCPLRP